MKDAKFATRILVVRSTISVRGPTDDPTSILEENGLLTIPTEVLERLGLQKGDSVDLIIRKDGTVCMQPSVVESKDEGIVHEPWRFRNSELVENQRIAIVGYSHYRDKNWPDHNGFTQRVLSDVISGKQTGDSFFPMVPLYFGEEGETDFWNRVTFFNFLPECIGTDEEKHETGTKEQHERARIRFLSILRDGKYDKVFVFTTKGWLECPLTIEEQEKGECISLGEEFLGTQLEKASWGTYSFDGHTVMVCGFRHPQFANRELMTAAVQKFLQMPLQR